MATAYDDDSTDDEIGMNLQLAERLNLHRGDHTADQRKFDSFKDYKQYCNLRAAQQFSTESSSSSIDIPKECSYSAAHRSYVPPNKKRQNGDKNLEQFANPKRTCLSDRFPSNSNWNGSREETVGRHPQLQPPSELGRDLYPDKTYEDHLNNLADAEDSDLEPFSYKVNKWDKRLNGQRSMQSPGSGMCPDSFESPSVIRHGVQFIESGSDDDSKPACQKGALKGGRQSPDYAFFNKKIVGRKAKKLLDSDDTDEDKWHSNYRTCPVVFSSSDSEDGGQERICLPENGISEHHANHSFPKENRSPHCDPYSSRRHAPNVLSRCHRQPPTCSSASSSFQPQGFMGDSPQFLAPPMAPLDFQGNNASPSCRTRRNSRLNLPPPSPLSQNSFAPNLNPSTSSVRGRNRRGSRNPGSPLVKSVHRPSETQSPRGRTHARREKSELAATYPDLFDEEDSSEVEFFTANSYSDTETSNESLGLSFTVNTEARNNRSVICDIASSEDEISVVFSNTPRMRNNDLRRGARALGRRYGRGTGHRHLQSSQEVVSLSPDPVEQVRQMEEDERFARMLQAQFDAEVRTAPPRPPPVVAPHLVLDWTDSDDSIIDPVGGSDSEEPLNQPLLPFVQPPIQRRGTFRLNNRFVPNSLVSPSVIFSNRRPDGRGRRRFFPPEPRWQLTRWFGPGPVPSLLGLDASEDDYETLLAFTEMNGDVPRGLQRSQINRLPTRQYRGSNSKPGGGDGEVAHKRTELNKECQVCLSDYVAGDVLRILPCFHEFHTPCIDPWLKINHTCPVCRVVVNLDD